MKRLDDTGASPDATIVLVGNKVEFATTRHLGWAVFRLVLEAIAIRLEAIAIRLEDINWRPLLSGFCCTCKVFNPKEGRAGVVDCSSSGAALASLDGIPSEDVEDRTGRRVLLAAARAAVQIDLVEQDPSARQVRRGCSGSPFGRARVWAVFELEWDGRALPQPLLLETPSFKATGPHVCEKMINVNAHTFHEG